MQNRWGLTLLFITGTVYAQIPDRNCLSNPFMTGCPQDEQSRKLQELTSKPIDWSKTPGVSGLQNKTVTPGTKRLAPVAPVQRPVADNRDWRLPRLAAPLPEDWPRWTFAQPDAGAVVGMKLNNLLKSPVLNDILASFLGPEMWKKWQTAAPPVDEIWISLKGGPEGRPSAVMLLIGAPLESTAVDLRSKGATVCFLDTRTLLAGEWSAVNDSLQRVVAGTSSPIGKRAGTLWSKNDVWMIVGRQMLTDLLPPNTPTAGITGASLGIRFQDKISVDMLLTAATPAEAARLAAKFRQNPNELGLGDVTVEKTVQGVRAQASFDAKQMPEALRHQLVDQLRPLLDNMGQKSATKAVVIQGLDDGPRTIPEQRQ